MGPQRRSLQDSVAQGTTPVMTHKEHSTPNLSTTFALEANWPTLLPGMPLLSHDRSAGYGYT
jgi:hypothetical protein